MLIIASMVPQKRTSDPFMSPNRLQGAKLSHCTTDLIRL